MLPTRRQKAVLDAIQEHVGETGRMPTLHELARRCGLSSVATVHRHVALLQERGLLRRRRGRRRGIELKPAARSSAALGLQVTGTFLPGRPIETHTAPEAAAVPRDFVRREGTSYALRVRGDALRPAQILDGDLIVLERAAHGAEGDLVVADLGARGAMLGWVRPGRGRLRLAAPPEGGDDEVQSSELRIHGVVLGLLRRFD
jgi:repressor LexA